MCSFTRPKGTSQGEAVITHEVRITFRASGTHRSKNKKAVHRTAFVFVLCSLNRCQVFYVACLKVRRALLTANPVLLINYSSNIIFPSSLAARLGECPFLVTTHISLVGILSLRFNLYIPFGSSYKYCSGTNQIPRLCFTIGMI